MAESLLLLLILVPLLSVDAQSKHFMGGSLSFRFVDTSNPTEYKVELTTVTGWVLGHGPCGESCYITDVGMSTITSRNHMLDMNGDLYFGNWTLEAGFSLRNVSYGLITDKVSKRLTGEVAAVNVPLQWEQEIAEVVLEIDPLRQYTDVELHGYFWKDFDYGYEKDTRFHLQVKINAHERNDTGQPNNSPVAMFKPTYKILLNSRTVIKLSTMDKDGDFVQCQLATFITAGGLPRPRNTTVNKDCSIEISAFESDHFFDQGWGAIPVKISDFNTKAITLKGDHRPFIPPGSQSLSDITVQFMIQTLKIIEAPEFVDPTKSSQHVFYVYAGSTLEIPLYAKPYDSSKSEISFFNVRSIPRRSFPIPPLEYDASRRSDGIKYAMVKWRPESKDVGTYVLSALVTDNLGNDGLDRNYNIIVRDISFTAPDAGTMNQPFFTLFPTDSVIRCLQNSTCSFPIYSTTKRAGGRIASVEYTTSTFENTVVSSPVKVTKNAQDMFETDVTVTSDQVVGQRICFEAYDDQGTRSEKKCLGVTMEIDDPCKLSPCDHGFCTSNGTTFECTCSKGFSGRLCEVDVDECASSPCQNNGTCDTSEFMPGSYFCTCVDGFTGANCETNINDCKPNSCAGAGVCIDQIKDFKCQCNKGHTGKHCEIKIHVPRRQKPTFSGPSFANGGVFKCVKNKTCTIPLFIFQGQGPDPVIKLGPHSDGLTVQPPDPPAMDPDRPARTDLYKSEMHITPTEAGEKQVCVKTGSTTTDVDSYHTEEYALFW